MKSCDSNNLENMCYMELRERKICFWASWRHTKRFGAWKKNLWTMTTNPLLPPPVVGLAAVKDSMVFFKGFPYVDGKKRDVS